VFQDHKLLYDRNVFQNVLLPLQIAAFDSRDAGRRARAALDKVGLLAKGRPCRSRSRGEQRRVCIARAVVHRPAVLLVDEPTGNLDEAYARDIVELFRSFHQVGVTVVIATHDRLVAEQLSARTIHLGQGRGSVRGWLRDHARAVRDAAARSQRTRCRPCSTSSSSVSP
jgi:cell division transport system ATP-binding protein